MAKSRKPRLGKVERQIRRNADLIECFHNVQVLEHLHQKLNYIRSKGYRV